MTSLSTWGAMRRVLPSLALALFLVGASAADPAPAMPDCSTEVTDPGVLFQQELCAAHLGCRMVLKVAKTCKDVSQFLDRLGNSVGSGVQTLFGRRREVQSDNVFDALQTDATRLVDGVPAAHAQADAARAGSAKARTTTVEGTLPDGSRYVYMGDVKDGQASGYGTRFDVDGTVSRGQWSANALAGAGDVIAGSPGGAERRMTGTYVGGSLSGDGADVTATGVLSDGRYVRGGLADGTRTQPDGTRFVGQFDPQGTRQPLNGTLFAADGNVLEKGSYSNGQLYVGERMESGAMVAVNRELDASRAAEQRQAEGVEQQRVALEQSAARQQKYQDELARMNPGQLYALADEQRSAGEVQKARQTLRTLVSRYPDHALATTAVSELETLGKPAPVRRPATQAVAAAPARPAAAALGGPPQQRDYSRCFDIAEEMQYMRESCRNHPIRTIAEACERNPDALINFLGGEAGVRINMLNEASQFIDLSLATYDDRIANASGSAAYVRHDVKRLKCAREVVIGNARPAAATSPFGPSSGNVCAGETLRNPGLESALARLPANDANATMRGGIVGIDLLIAAWQRCAADARASQEISVLRQQRAATLQACRQLSSVDNCEQSPF